MLLNDNPIVPTNCACYQWTIFEVEIQTETYGILPNGDAHITHAFKSYPACLFLIVPSVS